MSTFELQLKTIEAEVQSQLNLVLSDKKPDADISRLLTENVQRVYSDVSYELALTFDDYNDDVSNLELYINGENVPINFIMKERCININLKSGLKNLFYDCFGYIQIAIKINAESDSKLVYSDFLIVYLKKSAENRSLQRMMEYIYSHHEKYLYFGKSKPLKYSGVKENFTDKNLATVLNLLKCVIRKYKDSYAFFKANAKSKIIERGKVDNFDKMFSISSKTLQYISQHPEELIPVNNACGIKINKKYYVPKKALVLNKEVTYDIYEHQQIVGFLKYLYNYIGELINKLDSYVKLMSNPNKNTLNNQYFSSVDFIFESTIHKISEYKNEFICIKKSISMLLLSYQQIFNIQANEIRVIPKSTAIFMTLPQYNNIYMSIVMWFKFGEYNLQNEEFLLPFLVNNKLYEYYTLIKLLAYFENKGLEFDFEKSNYFEYRIHYRAKYKNTSHTNTFHFNGKSAHITIYFQPVIYGQKFDREINNEIGLFRNNSIRINSTLDNVNNLYYSPDFVIKIQKNNNKKYIILDAKYSKIHSVKLNYFSELVFKYLFSISVSEEKDVLDRLIVLCGKATDNKSSYQNVYDIAENLQFGFIKPYADIVTILEEESISIEEQKNKHNEIFDKIFASYIG